MPRKRALENYFGEQHKIEYRNVIISLYVLKLFHARLSRAGAVAEYVNGYVLFCGGRNGEGVHSDCLIYDPTRDMWSDHTRMTR